MHIPRSVSALRFQTCNFIPIPLSRPKGIQRRSQQPDFCTHLNKIIASEIKKFKPVMPRRSCNDFTDNVGPAPEYPLTAAPTSMMPAKTWY